MTTAFPIRLAQISDTHLFADPDRQLQGVKTSASLEAVINRLRKLNYARDVLLLTGDLSHDETPQSYQRLQDLVSPLQVPTYWIPGNHDRPSVMDEVLAQPPFHTDKYFEIGNWSFILLNSAWPGETYGRLSRTTLEWFEWQLESCRDRPTLVALHHPPFPVNSEWIDAIGLHNAAEFFTVLDRFRHVRLVLCGHVHQNFLFFREHVAYFATPSTCFQFQPKSIKFALDDAQPGFRLFNLYPGGSWETKVERIDESDRPLPHP